MTYTEMGNIALAVERIATAMERIAGALENPEVITNTDALDMFEATLQRAISAIESSGAPYRTTDVQTSIARMEYEKLGFDSPEALLKAWHER